MNLRVLTGKPLVQPPEELEPTLMVDAGQQRNRHVTYITSRFSCTDQLFNPLRRLCHNTVPTTLPAYVTILCPPVTIPCPSRFPPMSQYCTCLSQYCARLSQYCARLSQYCAHHASCYVTVPYPPCFSPMSQNCAYHASCYVTKLCPPRFLLYVTILCPPRYVTILCPPRFLLCHNTVPTTLPADVTFLCSNQGTVLQELLMGEAQQHLNR